MSQQPWFHAPARPHLRHPPCQAQEAQGLLGDTQAAFKLLMDTVREKEGALEALEGQADELRATGEALRRQRDEATAALTVGRALGALDVTCRLEA